MFLAILGAEAGHMGLRMLAKGGVYICGGIAPKVPLTSNLLGISSASLASPPGGTEAPCP